MMPLYENNTDRRREFEMISVIESARDGVKLKKLPLTWHIDCLMMWKGKPTAIAELRYRSHPYGHYSSFIIDKEKIDFGYDVMVKNAEQKNIRLVYYLFVSFAGEIRVARLKPKYERVEMSGANWKRGSNREERPAVTEIVHIPITEFKPLAG